MTMARHIPALAILAFLHASVAGAETVTVPASRDNTLFFDAQGAKSSGDGTGFYTGNTSTGLTRRALIAFDLREFVPAGSSVSAVTLKLRCGNVPTAAATTTVTLHRVLADWGEAGSIALDGTGGEAQTGDATWLHRFYPETLWTTAGGDFTGSASGSFAVPAVGAYTVSDAGLVADVQAWADHPEANFGWLLMGNESADQTARRFDSKESPVAGNRPVLEITFTPVPVERTTWGEVKRDGAAPRP